MESYDYISWSSPKTGKTTYRPLVDITIGSETQSRTIKALIDSSSDITLINARVATILGINPEGKNSGSVFGMGGGEMNGFFATVSIQVTKIHQVLHFTVLIVEDENEYIDIVLGQEDFFRNFKICFKQSEGKFYLEYINESI